MKRPFALFAAAALYAGIVSGADTGTPARERYLVALRPEVAAKGASLPMVGHVTGRFRVVDGYAAELTQTELDLLRRSPLVAYIEPDVERHALETAASADRRMAPDAEPDATTPQTMPYGVKMIGADRLWQLGTGRGIKVGVIDTGIANDHPELRGAYRGGIDLVNNDDDPLDDNGHGTHVAGTIAAANDAYGVVGIAPDVELYAIKVLSSSGSGSSSNVIRAVDWAIENDIDVLNLSLGSATPSALEEAAFQKAADAGILVFAAAGNDYQNLQREFISYPAGYPSVMAVGAVDSSKNIASFSQRGGDLEIVAPGIAVRSTYSAQTSYVISGPIVLPAFPMDGSPRQSMTKNFVYCGLGYPDDIPDTVRGNIALFKRGELTFGNKVRNAQQKGAVAAIVYNNVPGPFGGTLYDITDPTTLTHEWPLTVSMAMEHGDILRAQSGRISMSFGYSNEYKDMNGTSMATPHVAGAAALIWSLDPTAHAAAVRNALVLSGSDLGAPGFDTTYGNGLLNAYDAAVRFAPAKFGIVSRRRSARRG